MRAIRAPRSAAALFALLLAAGAPFASARQAPAVCGTQPCASYMLQGRVVHVADGDTVTLLAGDGQHRIRLASIDAPELGHGSDRPGQPFGQASRRHLAEIVAGKMLTARCYERDHYGRDVCDLPLESGTTASREQVASGYAWANTVRHGQYLRDRALPGLQAVARKAHRGLWRVSPAVAPWQWRYACWRKGQCGRNGQP